MTRAAVIPEPVYPYETAAVAELHPTGWNLITPTPVRVAALTPTQPLVSVERLQQLLDGSEPETGDPFPHVVSHHSRLYVHDGHHRYTVALARGDEWMRCRVVSETGRP